MDQIPIYTTIQSGNARLTLKIYPKPGADTIILLHGGPGVPDELTEVRETLAPYFRVITFNQRGTGPGGHKGCTYTIPDYLDDLNRIGQHLELSSFHLFGHSWGGLYAQLYAKACPEKIMSLFLCSPASGCGREIWKLTEREVFLYNQKRSGTIEWIGMGLNSMLGILGSSQAYRKLFRQVILNYHKGYNVEPPDPEKLAGINAPAVNRTRRQVARYAPLGPFGHTAFPVIITYGDQDAYGKSREFVFLRFPEARYVTISRCGHTPWKHNLPEFRKILENFYVI